MKKISLFLLVMVLLSFCGNTVYGAGTGNSGTLTEGLYASYQNDFFIADGVAYLYYNSILTFQ